MPKIPLLRDYKRKRGNTDNRKFRQLIYLDKRWKLLRDLYFKDHPLCENCLEKGIIKAGEDVHHIQSFMQFKNDLVLMEKYAFSYDNLRTLCRKCHTNEHSKK